MAKGDRKQLVLPELERATRKVRDLKPYAQNARTHTADQVEKIAASMRTFGWTNAVLVDEEDTIIAGHGRVLAGDLLGVEDAPVVVARGWSAEMIRAYVIADNKLALDAGWDDEILKAELAALELARFDMALTGFGEGELEAILRAEEEAEDEDDEPEEDEPEQTCMQCGRVVVPDKDLTRRAKKRRKVRQARRVDDSDQEQGEP
ncbi:ParB/Srx family N-terminal domain-containing protein [Bosea sp. TWI1241]|uniref:ParB/Srx family N-terminal domain-containing protein n=1 Tax=Bosea sp. TWI1241 TaxID=3148904 RepID=UPI00320A8D79